VSTAGREKAALHSISYVVFSFQHEIG
jgi:hypothetical protein